MRRPVALISPFIAVGFYALNCHEKPADTEISLRGADFSKSLPIAAPADAPEFVRSLSLLYPQSEIFRVDNRIVQKTNHRLANVVAYYQDTLAKHGFSETTKLEQADGALLKYERAGKENAEAISVDIQKLPYADNYLIRLTRTETGPAHGKKE
jgi:hypothetical protein